MAITEEFLRTLVEVKGDQALIDLQTKMVNLGREVANLKNLNQQAAITEELLEKELIRVANEAATTEKAIAHLTGSSAGTAPGGAGKGGISGQGIMGLSFAVQDFASANGDLVQGLYRIQNNIPVLLSQLGMDAGLAGTISLVSLGIGLLMPKLVEFGQRLIDTQGPIKNLDASMAGLAKTIKDIEAKGPITNLVDDLTVKNARNQLEALKRSLAEFDKMREEKTEEQRAQGTFFTEAMAERPVGGIKATSDELLRRLTEQRAGFEQALGQFKQIDEEWGDMIQRAEKHQAFSMDQARKAGMTFGTDLLFKSPEQLAEMMKERVRVQKQAIRDALKEASQAEIGAAEQAMAGGDIRGAQAYINLLQRAGMAQQQQALINRLREGTGEMGPRPPLIKEMPERQKQQTEEQRRAQEAAIRDEEESIKEMSRNEERKIKRENLRKQNIDRGKAELGQLRRRRQSENADAEKESKQREAQELAEAIRGGMFGVEGTQFSEKMAEEAAAKAIQHMNLLGVQEAGAAATAITLEAMGEIANQVMNLIYRNKANEEHARFIHHVAQDMNVQMNNTINGRIQEGTRMGQPY